MPIKPLLILRSRLALALLAIAVCVAGPAQAQWKWRDKDGRVTASDLPPPREIPDKDILSRPAPEVRRAPAAATSAASAPLPGANAKGPLDREVEARRLAAEREQAAKVKAEEDRLSAQRAENCRRARSQLAALESGQRIARVNDKGETEFLDDRARAEDQRRARDVIASDCR